jgi:hypothetical protein
MTVPPSGDHEQDKRRDDSHRASQPPDRAECCLPFLPR